MDVNVLAILTIWLVVHCVTIYSVIKLLLRDQSFWESKNNGHAHRKEEYGVGIGIGQTQEDWVRAAGPGR